MYSYYKYDIIYHIRIQYIIIVIIKQHGRENTMFYLPCWIKCKYMLMYVNKT